MDVRADLVTRYRRLAVRYAGLGVGSPPQGWSGRFAALADRLEAGEPVELYGWQLRRWVPGRGRDVRVLVRPDGSLTRTEPSDG